MTHETPEDEYDRLHSRIALRYSAIDGVSKHATFKTLPGARRWAHKWVGATPEVGTYYAISGDGIGKIQVFGGATLAELFGPEPCRSRGGRACVLAAGHKDSHRNADGFVWYNRTKPSLRFTQTQA